MPDPGPPARAKVVAALLAVYIIWGSTYLGIRIVVETTMSYGLSQYALEMVVRVLVLALESKGSA